LMLCIVIGRLIYLFFKLRILTYNRGITREILRVILRKMRRTTKSITLRVDGKELRLATEDIHYVKTDRNYLEVYTAQKKYLVRSSIPQFTEKLPDELEFLQVHRSYLVRIEHIQEKGKKELQVLNTAIPIGRKYKEGIDAIEV